MMQQSTNRLAVVLAAVVSVTISLATVAKANDSVSLTVVDGSGGVKSAEGAKMRPADHQRSDDRIKTR